MLVIAPQRPREHHGEWDRKNGGEEEGVECCGILSSRHCLATDHCTVGLPVAGVKCTRLGSSTSRHGREKGPSHTPSPP